MWCYHQSLYSYSTSTYLALFTHPLPPTPTHPPQLRLSWSDPPTRASLHADLWARAESDLNRALGEVEGSVAFRRDPARGQERVSETQRELHREALVSG